MRLRIPPANLKGHKLGVMNGLEERYSKYLDIMKQAEGEDRVIEWRFEALRLQIARRTSYMPDFFVVYADRLECHETKGRWTATGRSKWKTAAEMYPFFVFKAIQWKKKKWVIETYGESK